MANTENLTRDEAAERSSFLATDSYDVRLDLTTGEKTFLTESTIRFTSREARPTFVDLIAPAVREIELNGELLDDPASRFDGARVQLPALREGENVVRILAEGAYTNTGEGLHRMVDPVDNEVYLYTQFEVSDARRMFANFEQPDLKASFTFTITAPAHWRVISIAPTPEPTPAGEGTATWAFEPTPRISTYLTALIAGNYQGTTSTIRTRDGRDIPAGVYARASLAEHLDAENILATTQAGFDLYQDLFDQDYPFPTYDQIFVPEYNMGAMEHPGAVTFVEAYVFRSEVSDAMRERRDLTILHELAHMWFGDLVTMKWWDDLWLNESFAEYASTHAMTKATRWENAWTTFAISEKAWAYNQDQLPSTHPIVADMVDFDAVETNFDGITYAKGASVLRQLVAYVGEDAFFAGLRRYFAKHAWGNTQLKDLLVELEATSGRDLADWSRLWLETAGVNLLRPEIEKDADGTVTRFAVRQEATAKHPTLRPHRLGIAGYSVQDGRLVRTTRVDVDIDSELTEIAELVGERADLWLLNDGDLTYAKIRLDEDSLRTALDSLRTITDPLARTLIWGAAWDMVRDAELPSRRFHELVAQNLSGEDESSVIRTLIAQFTATGTHYAAPDDRPSRTERTADALWSFAEQADAGSDAQFQMLMGFLRTASTKAHAQRISALLSGEQQLEGREFDTDLRWEALVALVSLGAADVEQIEQQLTSDNTQSGRKRAREARAARPSAAAKQEAWELVVDRDELPNEHISAVIAGFQRVQDPSLIAPYQERYFAMLRPVWESRSNEIASRITGGLFPFSHADEATAQQARTWLEANADAPFGLRRTVMESLDSVERKLRVQAADRA